jgi:hypothetical protein
MVNDSQGAPLPEAQAELTVVESSFFPSYSGFASSVDIDHNNAPFSAGTQGYIWGYDNRTESGASEWILLTSAGVWTIPDAGSQSPSDAWSVRTASEVIVGSVSEATMTLGSVTVPSPPAVVPEPSSASLLALGAIAILATRRRRPARSC